MPIERIPACEEKPKDWRALVVYHYMRVPKTFRELVWKTSLLGLGLASTLTGVMIWKNPGIIFGKPVDQQSLIHRLSAHEDIKKPVFELMERFYYQVRPHGLMLVAWEELESFVGVWVRPADKFPGKSGGHGLTPDMRALGGPFLFGECASTKSLALEGKIMVACPINSNYDSWGYVAAIVDKDDVEDTLKLLGFLSHRITILIY